MSISTFGERVRELRYQRGWSQEHLAKEVGCSTRQIVQWELGKTKTPNDTNLSRLASALGVTKTYLLTGTETVDDKLAETFENTTYIERPVMRFTRRQASRMMSEAEAARTPASDGSIVADIRMQPTTELRLYRQAALAGMSVNDYLVFLLNKDVEDT